MGIAFKRHQTNRIYKVIYNLSRSISNFETKFIIYQYFYYISGGQLYSGTVSDFSGSDALIFRGNLRTEQYDLKHLNGK